MACFNMTEIYSKKKNIHSFTQFININKQIKKFS